MLRNIFTYVVKQCAFVGLLHKCKLFCVFGSETQQPKVPVQSKEEGKIINMLRPQLHAVKMLKSASKVLIPVLTIVVRLLCVPKCQRYRVHRPRKYNQPQP
jgi:hypothetical protein